MQQLDNIETIKPEPPSPISLHSRHKSVLSNSKPSTNKMWEIYGDQGFTNYLPAAFNMIEYKNGYQHFHVYLALIARSLSINELKNIFNAIFF